MNSAYSCDPSKRVTAASAAFLGIQQAPHKQHPSWSYAGTAEEPCIGSGALDWPQWCLPWSLLLWLPSKEWQSHWQHSTDTDSLVIHNIFVTLTSTPGIGCEPAWSCICSQRWYHKHPPTKPASAQLQPTAFFFHWEKGFYVGLMLCIMQLCHFWLGRQSLISGSSILLNCG